MSLVDCFKKFKNCVAFAIKAIDKGKISEFMRVARELENVDDVGSMVKLLIA